MKILFYFIFLLSTSVSHAFDVKEFLFGKKEKRVSCKDGAGSQHTNPDNSLGGFVAKTAKVEAGAFIASGAQACEFATIKSGANILGNAVISGRAQISSGVEISGFAQVMGEAKVSGNTKISGSVIIEGSPQISGSTTITSLAKVTGGSKIHNAIICQASQIENFDVIDSDYYCQTEDPEPPYPGEMGKQSLLGIDSDLDGVRDDVEIWINQRFSNTPEKDFYNERMALKQYAKAYQQIMKYVNVEEIARQKVGESMDALECLLSSYEYRNGVDKFKKPKTKKEKHEKRVALDRASMAVLKVIKSTKVELLNTKDRIKADIKVNQYMHGRSLGGELKSNGGNGCNFKFR